QTAQAREIFARGQVWIAKTVLLETNWVLTRLYGLSESDACDAFEKLLGLPSVQAEDSQTVWNALALGKKRLEFADALHVCSRAQHSQFVTFDRTLAKRAVKAGETRVVSTGQRR